MFASSGEKLEDFDVFHPERMAGRILDMGDMMTLIEQAEKAFDQAEAEKMAGKLARNEFTLDDFLKQMEQLKKLGSMKKLLGMLPGVGEIKQQLNEIDDKDVDRIAAIIKSMTPGERDDVKIINGSRRQRIARGSGTTVQEVNNLIERFLEAKKMMQQMARGGMPGMPGLPGAGGMGGTKRKSAKAKAADRASKSKGRSRSGNPAKAKAEEAARQARKDGNGAGIFGGEDGDGQFELPAEFRNLLPPQ
jgi:signal recognition particle subunit SRP54